MKRNSEGEVIAREPTRHYREDHSYYDMPYVPSDDARVQHLSELWDCGKIMAEKRQLVLHRERPEVGDITKCVGGARLRVYAPITTRAVWTAKDLKGRDNPGWWNRFTTVHSSVTHHPSPYATPHGKEQRHTYFLVLEPENTCC